LKIFCEFRRRQTSEFIASVKAARFRKFISNIRHGASANVSTALLLNPFRMQAMVAMQMSATALLQNPSQMSAMVALQMSEVYYSKIRFNC
jgi:hypothetical protein